MHTCTTRLLVLCWVLAYSGIVVGDEAAAAGLSVRSVNAQTSRVDVLGAQTRFVTDGSGLTLAGQQALDRLLDKLDDYERVVAIRVVGHTDSVGDAAYNQRLSLRRAGFVRELIAQRQIGVRITSVGAGESSPIAGNDTPAGRERNRRVEIHAVAMGSTDSEQDDDLQVDELRSDRTVEPGVPETP